MKTRICSCVEVFFVILMLSATVLAMPATGQERHDPVSGIDFVWSQRAVSGWEARTVKCNEV